MQTSPMHRPNGISSGKRRLRRAVAVVLAVLACSADAPMALAKDGALRPVLGRQPDARAAAEPDKGSRSGGLPDMAMGAARAPVTIIEYASLTCGHCARFHATTLPVIMKRYIDSGKVRYIFREFPLDTRAEAGAMLARCAKDSYFDVVAALFQQQGKWAHAIDAQRALLRVVAPLGFSRASFEACLTDRKLQADVETVRARATAELGVRVTPTFFVNGTKYTGALSPEKLSAIVDALL
ncbi:DsbA family protein [Ciceribacter sp. RN22]|uniref:DsbA family protein n=1 Tax=Ciceribacter sp. RN22 TaxID=2954932 RepID=UPI0020934C0C|nr:DsbA family protein [Ciceribacter sp. RN22]MCO6180967.1 DsbA family protein [Ciceribacter sp. RN22]